MHVRSPNQEPPAQELESLLDTPTVLLDMKFNCTRAAPGDAGGKWYVDQVIQGRVKREFSVVFEDRPGAVPMDVMSLHSLLKSSVVVE